MHSSAAKTRETLAHFPMKAEPKLFPDHTHTSASGRWTGTGKGRPAQPGAHAQYSPQGSLPPPSAFPLALRSAL